MNLNAAAIINKLADKTTVKGYEGSDGLIYCLNCGYPKEMWLIKPELGIKRKVPIMCACQKKREEERMKVEWERQIEINRDRCFQEAGSGTRGRLLNANFKTDLFPDSEPSKVARGYAKLFQEAFTGGDVLKKGTGLLFFGPVGTGKSFYAACIANAIIDRGYTALYTTFGSIATRMLESYEARPEIMSELDKPSLLILDDLGAERDTEYIQEIVFEIINLRYRRSKPIIVTTNAGSADLKGEGNTNKARIYDRLLEMCEPVEVAGQSKRRTQFNDRHRKQINAMKGEADVQKV